MDATIFRRFLTRALGVLGAVLLLASLWLLSESTQNSQQFGSTHVLLLLLNSLAAIALLALLAINLWRLLVQYRSHVPGTRLTGRMVGMFIVLAMLPLLTLYYFSLQSINRSIETWFDVRVEEALDDALELSRTALDLRMQELLADTQRDARGLALLDELSLGLALGQLRQESGAAELTVFGSGGRVVATSSSSMLGTVERPDDEVIRQVHQGLDYVALDPVDQGGLFVQAVVRVPGDEFGSEQWVLHALYPVRTRLNELASSVQGAYSRYRELSYLRTPLRYSFTLTLTLILLVTLLAAVWGAFFAARRLVAPIQELARGTRAVAKGDFDTRLDMPSQDELGFLVVSFNEMTKRLSEARDEARSSRQAVEDERAYLQSILTRLSTGVIAFDEALRLTTANEAAGDILGSDLGSVIGEPLGDLTARHDLLGQLCDVLESHMSREETDWREEIVLRHQGSRRVLMCSCTTLGGSEGPSHILVFDDLTALIQAQRDSAWGEVARRLAHEIKNPLTPIQLSAERIQHRLVGRLEGDDQALLERATHTIVQQVEAMKAMVNAFGDYARAPSLQLTGVDLNELVVEVVDLYRSRELGVELVLGLESSLPTVEADAGRLRQILHNLMKNAMEALSEAPRGRIEISTRSLEEDGLSFVDLVVQDDGPGFQDTYVDQVFDPYVTSKPKGTGLGLAVVKKLVEEHSGHIEVDNAEEGGARVAIRLPVDENARTAMLLRGVSDLRKASH